MIGAGNILLTVVIAQATTNPAGSDIPRSPRNITPGNNSSSAIFGSHRPITFLISKMACAVLHSCLAPTAPQVYPFRKWGVILSKEPVHNDCRSLRCSTEFWNSRVR